MIRNLFITTALMAVICLAAAPVSAQMSDGNAPNYLFSQYATPNGPNMTTAGMYPAPHYSPQLGAQSYYTYQPLMPHEMMYQHSRNYFNYYSTNGYNTSGSPDSVTKTSVRWQSGTHHIAPLRGLHGFSGFHYRIHSRMYGLNRDCGGGDVDCDGSSFGKKRRHRHHGSRGCRNGNCDTCDVYGETECNSCASGCIANLNDSSLQR
jgi:hypothetical protein